jgi:hypothetical protein
MHHNSWHGDALRDGVVKLKSSRQRRSDAGEMYRTSTSNHSFRASSAWRNSLYPAHKFAEALDEAISINIPQSADAGWGETMDWPPKHSSPLTREHELSNGQPTYLNSISLFGTVSRRCGVFSIGLLAEC